ncbi:hypothetical protein BH23ACT2_BH23ACT2_04980 [soil metagenome]
MRGGDGEGGDDEVLRILVTNDDSYEAEGIDAVVEGLLTLDAVEVEVVAPLEEQSGQGGRSTLGDLEVTDVELTSGYEARAVDGFPADSVRVAIDELGVEADLVVSGINSGQNLGPLVDISGTVGGARAAVARDIPALATSQGFGDDFDYDSAVPLILDWVEERRDDLISGNAPVELANLNIPSCDEGEVRDLVTVEVEADRPGGDAVVPQDCTVTEELGDDDGDVTAFAMGYATLSVVPDEPVEPAEVVDPG